MKSAGFLATTTEAVNSKLAVAIEELRVKYEKKAEEEKKAAEEEAAKKAAEAAKVEAAREKDWVMEDPELEALRKARMNALKNVSESQKKGRERGNGDLREIVEEDFLKEVTGAPLVVVHFFHREFERCKVMDVRLQAAAHRNMQTRFLKLNAEKAPFFITKLSVKVLPTVIFFVDGVAVGRVTGFEGCAAGTRNDDVSLPKLLHIMGLSGVLGDAAKRQAVEEEEGDDFDEEAELAKLMGGAAPSSMRRGGGVGSHYDSD